MADVITIPLFGPCRHQAMVAGSCEADSAPYLKELGVRIIDAPQKIQFSNNASEPVHRWAPYIQGFSASFVRNTLMQCKRAIGRDFPLHVHDPFAGCGTVLVESKMSGLATSTGTELNPLLSYVTSVKVGSWDVSPQRLWESYKRLRFNDPAPYPDFLETERQFEKDVLKNLQLVKGAIDKSNGGKIRDLLRVAFASILIDCSKLKRTPCLGYQKDKVVAPDLPFRLFEERVRGIKTDLELVQEYFIKSLRLRSEVHTSDARQFKPEPVQMVITSPPYMNGLDYVMNYKIEMAWLGFTKGHPEAKDIKDRMVSCDNISKLVTRQFAKQTNRYSNRWIEEIVERLNYNIANWGKENKEIRIKRKRKNGGEVKPAYRRTDMPLIVHKYFDDMHQVLERIYPAVIKEGRLVLVIGDSYIADVYVPTDLIIARMGEEVGFQIESLEKVRNRRSGQIMSYKLRETVVTLKK